MVFRLTVASLGCSSAWKQSQRFKANQVGIPPPTEQYLSVLPEEIEAGLEAKSEPFTFFARPKKVNRKKRRRNRNARVHYDLQTRPARDPLSISVSRRAKENQNGEQLEHTGFAAGDACMNKRFITDADEGNRGGA